MSEITMENSFNPLDIFEIVLDFHIDKRCIPQNYIIKLRFIDHDSTVWFGEEITL